MIRKPYQLINGDCLDALRDMSADCIFADPPDNIGLKYSEYNDRQAEDEYKHLLHQWTLEFMQSAPIVWISFNSRWTFAMGKIFDNLLFQNPDWEAKACVQTFTFGQHNHHDLGNCHRPLWRLKHKDAPLYPDQVRVPSWRQLNGDKRADPRGRVASDHFDFPRVTGNSKQRRSWHPTQLHEDLVARCIQLSTTEGQHVIDPFGGTGTTLRVCKKINRGCTLIEIDPSYCEQIRNEHNL
jgi:site-specific DNA-methyltransferase (adenine-specific)